MGFRRKDGLDFPFPRRLSVVRVPPPKLGPLLESVVPAQILSAGTEQGVSGHPGQVFAHESGRVRPPGGPPARDDGDLPPGARRDERRLRGGPVDRVQAGRRGGREACEDLVDVARRHEVVDQGDSAIRIDLLQAFLHHIDLHPPDRSRQGVELSIRVGDADVVKVDQDEVPNPRPAQRLGGPRSHPPQAHHHNAARLQSVYHGHVRLRGAG